VKSTHPPRLATKLLEALVSQRTSEALVGDLIEQYQRRSRGWYWRQVLTALVISARRELRAHRLSAVSAVLIGYVTAASLCYFTTSVAGRFVGGYNAYLVFLPLVFFSAAASGWIVRRSHPPAMVIIYAGFCVAASVVAFAVYAWLPLAERMPIPILTFFLVVDFIIGPLGVLTGGVWGSSGAREAPSSSALDTR
jgi:hypothetical protein